MLKGKDFILYIDDEPVCYEQELSININTDTQEVTAPPDSVWKSYAATHNGYSIETSGLCSIPQDGKKIFDDLQLAQINRTPLTWKAMDKSGTGRIMSGQIIITSSSKKASVDGFCKYSITAIGTGKIV